VDFYGGYVLRLLLLVKLKDELSETRENIAITYASKEDVKDDLKQLLQRFDRLESKIDDMIRRHK
tara:strand:+ start:3163 stop:3357 length:195 start_codon:yes stop_codon:yes gene_type:complete